MSDDKQDEKPKRGEKGGPPGPGRPKGSKDSVPRLTRKEIAEFFRDCSVEGVEWRQHFKRKLAMALDPSEFHNLSKLALLYGIGVPIKEVPEVVQRPPILWLGTPPWEGPNRMDAKSDAMNKANDEEIRQRALEAGQKTLDEVIIDAKPKPEEEEMGFESVPETLADPSATRDMDGPPELRPRERDRQPRNER